MWTLIYSILQLYIEAVVTFDVCQALLILIMKKKMQMRNAYSYQEKFHIIVASLCSHICEQSACGRLSSFAWSVRGRLCVCSRCLWREMFAFVMYLRGSMFDTLCMYVFACVHAHVCVCKVTWHWHSEHFLACVPSICLRVWWGVKGLLPTLKKDLEA